MVMCSMCRFTCRPRFNSKDGHAREDASTMFIVAKPQKSNCDSA